MEYNWHTFPTIGYVSTKFTNEELLPVRTEIEKIRNNFDNSEKFNHKLAGNIRKEFTIKDSKDHIEKLLIPLIACYDYQFKLFDFSLNALTDDLPFNLDTCWVNFQLKDEYNPVHNHRGFMSFVIWIDVPYDFVENYKNSPGVDSTSPAGGTFEFVYANTTGRISNFRIPVDKSMINSAIMFPSNFAHSVYPFHSSDGYRISVSGNFKFKVKQ